MRPISRRTLLAAGLLAGCSPKAEGRDLSPLAPLRQVAPFPVGACVSTPELADPAFTALLTAQFSQVTPEWEMKMERILGQDGALHFEAADAIAGFARDNGLRLHATTLAWYAQKPVYFERLASNPPAFAAEYQRYIATVVGRYRGAAGWDVVNEAVAEDGAGYRDCLWRQVLGLDYMRLAFEQTRAADPDAVLFLNDYNLEYLPAKLASFQRLLEALLKQGAPVTGIGTQTHLAVDTPKGVAGRAIRELAHWGLPIHVSELDVTYKLNRFGAPPADPSAAQARIVGEVADAFMALPAAQRYAFTAWGVRDRDSWLRHSPQGAGASDKPLLFDDTGRPKPAARALVKAV